MINLSFKQKLFIPISIVFIVFTIFILLFQYEREKQYRKGQLENTLDNITELSHKFIEDNSIVKSGKYILLDSLKPIVPKEGIRITIISPKGEVYYDSEVSDFVNMENHLQRPEVQESVIKDFGANIRTSNTTGSSYYYYSKFYTYYYVRTAVLYDIEVKDFLHVEKLFITFIVLLFVVVLLVLSFVTKRVTETIRKLKDFAVGLRNGKEIEDNIEFPADELGTIGGQIVKVYKELDVAKNEISIEKEKLFNHLHALNEGIAFFDSDKNKVLTNNHYIQFLSIISENTTISPENIFNVESLEKVNRFIDENLKNKDNYVITDELPYIEIDVDAKEKYFNVQCIFFKDYSFEVVIKDITKLEKRRRMKQQMTSNISHELKTPVATVLGYLETVKGNNLTEEKRNDFISKAFNQAKRLSDLVEDISVLNRIEESKDDFTIEPININSIVKEVSENLRLRLDENNIKEEILFDKDIVVNGNKSLMFSVFYNLFDNAIKYGGEDITITVANYLEDKNYYYFSFHNTGVEINEEHLSRIFERFYRVDDGRSRKNGGTGLGLAIVKNAIQLHGGEISAKNNEKGGVEFLFTLEK